MLERFQPTPIMHRYVKYGGMLHFGGLIAEDASLSMSGQTEQVLRKLDQLLADAGSDRSKVVSATVFITDMSLKSEMNAVWSSWFGSHLPTRATIGIADLGEGVLIEVVFLATV